MLRVVSSEAELSRDRYIEQVRERLGLALGEVSRRTAIDMGDLSRVENGKGLCLTEYL